MQEVLDQVSDIENIDYMENAASESEQEKKPKYRTYSARELEENLE